ncbi:MAG TPA: hypothetical protein DIT47_00320, partial [Flavobacteriaceae bacterium]|nr:hypothetical protein [Flavobacteriaceae bacterium]
YSLFSAAAKPPQKKSSNIPLKPNKVVQRLKGVNQGYKTTEISVVFCSPLLEGWQNLTKF